MVHLQRLHERYSDDGLLVHVISIGPAPAAARSMTREMGVTYPVLTGNGSALGEQYAYG